MLTRHKISKPQPSTLLTWCQASRHILRGTTNQAHMFWRAQPLSLTTPKTEATPPPSVCTPPHHLNATVRVHSAREMPKLRSGQASARGHVSRASDWCISSRATPNTPQHCAAAKAQGRP